MTRAAAAIAASILVLFFWMGSARAQKPTREDCLACHGDSNLTKDVNGKPVSLYVNPDRFKASMHGSVLACVDCHTDVRTSPHEKAPAKISCASCHSDQQTTYDRSLHAKAISNGDKGAATCVDCHGGPHELLPSTDPGSRTNHANIPATCGRCHSQPFIMKAGGNGTQAYVSYQGKRPWSGCCQRSGEGSSVYRLPWKP